MADFHPILARAIAGLTDKSPEARRAVYDRARAALLSQLRSLDPPLSAADITREVRKRLKKPLWVKLSPNVSDIASIAQAVTAPEIQPRLAEMASTPVVSASSAAFTEKVRDEIARFTEAVKAGNLKFD